MIVVDIFKGSSQPPWKLRSKWNQCKHTLSSMSWVVSHVYREGDTCADKLANFGLSIQNTRWWNFVPHFIINDATRNRANLPNYRFVH
ncbi:unnamed protein product [Lupinus luteus]|uniref:RNase H type-1 domain-containing protein n=1 Tax=Lupinus luteus TaxID=3873 RepID=A0AAV1Y6C8_LUPLU